MTSSTPTVPYSRRFTVCLTPLNNDYNRAYELVEWIELNRLLGAEKFTVYNYSSAANVKTVLEHYSAFGTIDIVQWQIPLAVETFKANTEPEIHYFGQLAALQDCLYRNMQESEYLVNIDLDEFIIPKSMDVSTWSELLEQLPANKATFMFMNTFFRKEWPNGELDGHKKNFAEKFRLVTLLKNKREKPFPAGNRSKYITKTSAVARLHVHTVFLPSKHGGMKLVSPDVGLLHHYRNWNRFEDADSKGIQDDTIDQKYGDKLIENVVRVWKQLSGVALGNSE